MNYVVPIADPQLAKRKTKPDSDAPVEMSEENESEKREIDEIVEARKQYEQDRKSKEHEWTESFKMYMSWVDRTLNPYFSNLFIPKTHEAVELLAAFLIGTNQNITASAENGKKSTVQARVAGKWLDFMWRKTLKARLKILVWIKQGIVFGNGVMKVGWDNVTKKPWLNVCAIEDVYFDYFVPDIQDSEYVIHEIRRDKEDVIKDSKYDKTDSEGKLLREQVICGGEKFDVQQALFSTYDGSFSRSENKNKVLLMEVWCKAETGGAQRIKTLAPTSLGWRIIRDAENPNRWRQSEGGDGEQFRPFTKLRFKTSVLPNRAYDMGGVFPTVHIQKAFNDLMRQYFDGVVMINNPMGKKRRGARINPMEMVRRPGGIITMGDISKDFAWDNVPDIKASMIEMLNRLDREFQEASMVVNLIKGISQSETATGDAIAQQNVQTLLDPIDQNIVDALSELGQMVMAIAFSHAEGRQSVVLYENVHEVASVDFEPKNLDGIYQVEVVPDRTNNLTRATENNGLLKFANLVGADAQTIMQYPSIKMKIYKRFLENEGIGDPDYFFEEETPLQQPGAQPNGQGTGAPEKKVSVSMSYKDAPDDVRREIEQGAGFQPSRMGGSQQTGGKQLPALKAPSANEAVMA